MIDLELVVFDLVGTTIQDRGEVPDALQGAMLEHGLEIAAGDMKHLRGLSKREMIARLLGENARASLEGLEAKADAVYESFLSRLVGTIEGGGVHAMEGSAATFAWLQAHRIKVVLSTGFNRQITDLLLAQPSWSPGLIDASVCLDDVSQGRPAPYLIFRAMERAGVASVHRVAAVGDTRSDLQAAHNAGVAQAIGVLSGDQGPEELGAEPHTALVDSVAGLPALWASELD